MLAQILGSFREYTADGSSPPHHNTHSKGGKEKHSLNSEAHVQHVSKTYHLFKWCSDISVSMLLG